MKSDVIQKTVVIGICICILYACFDDRGDISGDVINGDYAELSILDVVS